MMQEITEDNVGELTQWWIVPSASGSKAGNNCHIPKAVVDVVGGDPLDTSEEPIAVPLCNSRGDDWLAKSFAQLPPGWMPGGICERCQNRFDDHKDAIQRVSEDDGE